MMQSEVYVYQQNMQQTDKDELFVCPFDPVHRITAKRFVRHILKCKKNHPKSDKKVCPFNARHIVPKPELQMHISTCPDKRLLENEINSERIAFEQAELRGDTSVPPYNNMEHLDFGTDEDWDEEIQQSMQEENNTTTRRQEILQHMQETRRMNGKVPMAQRRPLQGRPALGVGRGLNLLKHIEKNNTNQMCSNPLTTSAIQLAANFNRKPLAQSSVENESPTVPRTSSGLGLGRARRPRTGPKFVADKPNKVIVSQEDDKEISAALDGLTLQSALAQECTASSSESAGDPTLALRKEKKRLLKLLKQISVTEKQATSGAQLNPDEMAKLNRKPVAETRLFEINLELGED